MCDSPKRAGKNNLDWGSTGNAITLLNAKLRQRDLSVYPQSALLLNEIGNGLSDFPCCIAIKTNLERRKSPPGKCKIGRDKTAIQKRRVQSGAVIGKKLCSGPSYRSHEMADQSPAYSEQQTSGPFCDV